MENIEKLSDEKIVELVQKKDKELFAHIIRRYSNKLTRYAAYLIGDEDKAADVVQNSFIKAYINLNSFNTKKKFSSYIYRIVHNESINLIKKEKKHISLDGKIEIESNDNLEEEFGKKEIKKQVKKCLKKMPIIYREILSLSFLEEKTYEEISDILRIPKGTVGTRINRAKALMKKICKQEKI